LASSGFAIHAAVFDAREMRALAMALAGAPLARSRAGVRHILSLPAVMALANDPRLLAIAREWLGGSATPFKATLFDKSADANWLVAWHQDTALPMKTRVEAPGFGPWSEKYGVWYAHAPTAALEKVIALRVHLDDSSPESGPLRVLPGTHEQGVLSDADVAELARKTAPVDCVVAAGGVIAMRPLLIHASSKARAAAPRRVIHLEYATSLELGGGLRLHAA
jgi:ectoine hydroxylase-related dioxygenase (phytanoyl-CoA dioxygenase family)